MQLNIAYFCAQTNFFIYDEIKLCLLRMKFEVNICTADNNNINSNSFIKNGGSRKNQVLNSEPVLSLSCLVEDIQTKIQNNFIIVRNDLISHKKHNVDDPNTRQRYATITSDENNSHQCTCNYKFPIHRRVIYFQDCNAIDITLKS